MKKLLSAIIAVCLILGAAIPAFAEETATPAPVRDSAAVTTTINTIESTVNSDTARDKAASIQELKDDRVPKSDLKAFKGTFKDELVQLNKLRETCKANWAAIKGLNTSIKSEWTRIKGEAKAMTDKAQAKKELADLKARLEADRAKVTASHSKIKELRAEKKTEWTKFHAAIKARNQADAQTAINKILELKQQIIGEQGNLTTAKTSILNTLKATSIK